MSDSPVNTEILLQYLAGTLDTAARERIDQARAENPFLADALDGLAQVENQQQLPFVVGQLNARLRRQVNKRKQRRKKSLKQPQWMYVLLILLFVIIAWIALRVIIN